MSVLVDVNVLLYAKFRDFPRHEASRRWLDQALAGPEPVAIPWLCRVGFLRIATNGRVFEAPLTTQAALEQLDGWCSAAVVWAPEPGSGFRVVFEDLLLASQATANLVPDAWLAALAVERGLVIMTWDADFQRFPGVRSRAPETA